MYALQTLNLPNVFMYLDAGHAGWLGWPANLQPAATLYGQIYSAAGKPAAVRGLATNVANYNALSAPSADTKITQGNPNYDEIHYINALAPLLQSAGFPAHFIVDQGRSGVQGIRNEWGDWCNVKGAGFGTRPTTSTGSSLVDSVVWVKPGGECDGTSNTSAVRYDFHCGLSDAHQPAPEAGTWFQVRPDPNVLVVTDFLAGVLRGARPQREPVSLSESLGLSPCNLLKTIYTLTVSTQALLR